LQKSRSGDSLLHRPEFLAAVQAYRKSRGDHVHPDANLSLRITFGNVVGYVPRDGVAHTPFTTLEGLAAKATDTSPFDAPQVQLDAIAERRHGKRADAALGTVPVTSSPTSTSPAATLARRCWMRAADSPVWPSTATGNR
jgi:hypothetical protein